MVLRSGEERCQHVPATSRRNYQEEGMMEFWGNSGTEGAGESRKAVARPFEGRCMTY